MAMMLAKKPCTITLQTMFRFYWLESWPALTVSLLLICLPFYGRAAGAPERDMMERIQRGERFLTNLFDGSLQLLPEYGGSRTYWLFHDNYLAAHLLETTRPDLSRDIRSALTRFGVTNSGKIEIVFNEARQPLPFRTYVLTNVAVLERKTIRTELVTTNLLRGWEEYADLLLLSSLAKSRSAPEEARKDFDRAAALWDGQGFKDRAARHSGIYATYKLALYLIAAGRQNISPPHWEEVTARLLAMQAPDGGWKTDYKEGKPVGLTNVETTCLALLALHAMNKSSPSP